jgi:hypothetical protein
MMSTFVTPELTEEIHEYVTNVAASYARRYALMDPRDIKQHLYLMWFDRAKYVARYLEDSDPERGKARLLRSMCTWAGEYCLAETAAVNGYKPEDVHFYSRKQIRGLLPLLVEPVSWTSLAVRPSDGGRHCAAPLAERGDELAVLADLRNAWVQLSDADREILTLRFIDTGVGDPEGGAEEQSVWLAHETICDLYGITPDAARKRVQRAVTRMQKFLGGAKVLNVSTGRRPRMSNSAAAVVTHKYYMGDYQSKSSDR